MKSKTNPFLRHAIAASLALGFAAASASAGTQYWTGAGEWTDAKWSNTSGGTYDTAWTNSTADVAVFEGTGGIVTIANNINADRLDFNVTGYSLTTSSAPGAASAVTITGFGATNQNLAADVTATIGANVTIQTSNNPQSWFIQGGDKTTSILNVEGTLQNAALNFNSIHDSTVNVKTGGQLINASSLVVGTTTTGSGAALNVEGTVSIASTGTSLVLNNNSGITADSSITISDGGNITFTDTGNTNGIRFGPSSNVSGAATQLTGTVNLNGGTVTLNKIFVGSNYSGGAVYNSYVNLNGGTLKALRDQVDFMEGLTSVNVQAGGAIFDTNGKNITVSQALVADSATGGLEKNGTGTLTLDAASTYTGDTIVNNGTLAVSTTGGLLFKPGSGGVVNSVTGSETSSLSFLGTINLDLTSAATINGNSWQLFDLDSFTVNPLVLDAAAVTSTTLGPFTETSPGVWELPVTGAKWTFTEDDGTLDYTVTTTGTDYEIWGEPYGLAAGSEGGDLDNDGLTNFEEYAFGLIPNSGASANPIAAPLDKSTGTFSYTRRKPSLGTNLSYSVWFSTTLEAESWLEDTAASSGTPVPSGDNETVEVTLSTIPGTPLPPTLFIQVRAE